MACRKEAKKRLKVDWITHRQDFRLYDEDYPAQTVAYIDDPKEATERGYEVYMDAGEFVIIGDTEKHRNCLIRPCGTFERAKEDLQRMLTNPNENDMALMKGHTNIRIDFVPEQHCWWNDPVLAN